ncbi:LANO_0H20406g1_1 [Lachancea nothofagi CBS 11611]|uniref:Small ribosomal subunit protein uS5m n=1 Tax=Lachancea nothofagi CBS 11611 TaxID=1266666 RepID=A0A1G4KNC1_9SACH|nr:LANO_0H20406g1_1 [Lachancea nothofagi CBS 11611]
MFRRTFCTGFRALQQAPKAPATSHAEFLAKYYPQELLKSIQLAESVIPADTKFQVSANVEFAPSYLEDFSKLDSYWDYKPGTPHVHAFDSSSRYTFDDVSQPLPNGQDIAPGASLPRTDGSRASAAADIARGLQRQTGINPEFVTRKLTMRPLVMKRVSNQTGKGKIPSFYALVVVGDKNGMVGLGEGKSRDEMSKAVSKAHWDAVRNLKQIPRYENRTIYGDIDHRYHGVKLFLRSVKPGFGLRVNHIIFEICECAGIKDLSGKVYKSRNEMNIAKGVIEAFTESQKTLDEIALGRGKKVVDVRKVYYSS